MDNICRTCTKSSEKLLSLLEDAQLPHKIEIISSVQIAVNDSLPKHICSECIFNINLSYNFRELIISSDCVLRSRLSYKILKKEPADNSINNVIKNMSENGANNLISYDNEEGSLDSVENHDSKSEEMEFVVISDIEDDAENSKSKVYSLNTIENKVYKCRNCDFTHTEYKVFCKHKRTHWTKHPKIRKAICSICGKSIRDKYLEKHMVIHTDSPVACKKCGKVFKNTVSLQTHTYIHRGIEFKCKHCDKVYKHRSGYALHCKTHTQDNNYKTANKCHICGKGFRLTHVLKKHVRSHTGERPYLCEFCKKGFSSSYALKTHRRQHTNERPYACTLCTMAFPQKCSLQTHMKSKHPTEPAL